MKEKAWQRLVRPLLTEEWGLQKSLAYLKPVGWTLFGVTYESRNAPGFFLWRVRMPLVTPNNVLTMTDSERHGG